MTNIFWSEFGVLFLAAIVGGLAILPYSFELVKLAGQSKALKMSKPKLILLSLLQTAVLFAIVIAVGLLTAHAIGIGAPYFEARLAHTLIPTLTPMLSEALILGVVGGLFLFLFDYLFLSYLPKILVDTTRTTTIWQNLAASFYGGVNEELLMRLFGFSVIAWLLSRVWHTQTHMPTVVVLWTANIIMAIIFGLGHLPTTKNLVGKLTPFLTIRALLLNGMIGLVCGWLFWQKGIEAAMLAHFSADIIYHVGGNIVIRLSKNL
jgi:hypothetical protein